MLALLSQVDVTDPVNTSLVVISAPVVMLVVGLVIPLVNGALTKVTLHSTVKGAATIVLNAAAALVATATLSDGTAVLSMQSLFTAFYGVAVSLAAYLQLYKPLGLTSSDPDGRLSPHRGIGPNRYVEPTGRTLTDRGYGTVELVIGVLLIVILVIVLVRIV